MTLSWIALSDFRSYPELHWAPDPEVNILVGPNAAGKTNVLEAVSYLANLRSFRGTPDEALVADQASSGIVRGEVTRGGSTALIEIEINRRGGRRSRLDGKALARAADLMAIVRVVTFLPEDLDLVKGGPGARRDLLDDLAVQLWPSTQLDRAEFDRSLRQRNAFLKAGDRDMATLDVWDSRLAQAGARLMARRAKAAATLRLVGERVYSGVAARDSVLDIAYESDWVRSLDPTTPASEWHEALASSLAARRRVDLELRLTGAGPHRDDPVFMLDGRRARHQSSQGEQRTLALSLRIACHTAIAEQVGEPPLLLLDDVFSELDPDRAQALTAALPATQTMITTTRPEEIPVSGKVWRLESGMLR
jgi:DNA replication and repair protein RecF